MGERWMLPRHKSSSVADEPRGLSSKLCRYDDLLYNQGDN